MRKCILTNAGRINNGRNGIALTNPWPPDTYQGANFLCIFIPMNRKFIIPAAALLLLLAACKDEHSFKKAEDPQDAGREFIRAALDGNYEKASFYLYVDSTNRMLFNKWKKDYDHMDHEERKKYANADILPINIKDVNDSTTSYTYTNSYKKEDTTTILVMKVNGEWLVDLKEILKNRK